MKRRSKWAKKCKECGKIIASHNKSGLCGHHYKIAWKRTPIGKKSVKKTSKKYKKNNQDKIKAYYIKNREKIKERQSIYYQKNKKLILKKQHNFYINNKEKICEKRKKSYLKKKTECVTILK